MVVINSMDEIVVDFEYCCYSRMERSVRQIVWLEKKSTDDTSSKVLGNETFHEFVDK